MGSAVLGAISPITTVSCCFPTAATTKTLRGLPFRKFFDWLTVFLSLVENVFPAFALFTGVKNFAAQQKPSGGRKSQHKKACKAKFCGNMHGCKRPMGKPRQAGEVCRFATVFDAPQGLANASRQAKIASFSLFENVLFALRPPLASVMPISQSGDMAKPQNISMMPAALARLPLREDCRSDEKACKPRKQTCRQERLPERK